MRVTRDLFRACDPSRQASRQTLLAIVVLVTGLAATFADAAPQPAAPATTNGAPTPNTATFRVMGSREGLVGGITASGHRIQPNDYFVALPSTTALGKKVKLTYKGKSLTLPVKDVGPYNTKDDYWNPPDVRYFKGLPQGVSQAQLAYKENHNGGMSGIGIKVAYPLSIDIGDGAFYELGMGDSDWLEVTFLWLLDGDDRSDPDPDTDTITAAKSAATTTPKATATARATATAKATVTATATAKPPTASPTAKATATATPKRTSEFDPRSLPTLNGSARPPLDAASSLGGDYTYVDETKHNVPNVIARYWKAKGGVATFGFPVSEVFVRVTNGERHIYQYFERVLMEYLPDSDSVTLAPLGEWFAEVNGPYKTVAAFEGTETKRYVTRTKHSITGEILKYYAANGDADFFGAPLAEATEFKTTDGRMVTAQLFERARIEVDSKGTVTLGRLGVEWLKERDWT